MSGTPGVVAAQKALKASKGLIHLKGGSLDKLTSVAIPLTLAGVATGLLVKGLDDLYHGKNRKEGF